MQVPRRATLAPTSRHINNMLRVDFGDHEYETRAKAAGKSVSRGYTGIKFFKLDNVREYVAFRATLAAPRVLT